LTPEVGMKIEIDKKERNAVINGNNKTKTKERKGKKNGKKYINVYIYIYTIDGV